MRVITVSQILSFLLIVLLVITLSTLGTSVIDSEFPLPFTFSTVLYFVVSFYAWALFAYWCFRKFVEFEPGVISPNTKKEFVYHLDLLFHLLLFHQLSLTGLVPVPFRRLWYKALGAKLGQNTFPSGILLDPRFVEIGDFTVLGLKTLVCPHILVQDKIQHKPIVIGSHVTLGVSVTVYGGVEMEDYSMVLPHSVVNPDTKIGRGEVWGGSPAVLLKTRNVEPVNRNSTIEANVASEGSGSMGRVAGSRVGGQM